MDRPWISAGLKFAAISRADLPALLVQRVARLRGTAVVESGYLRYLISSTDFTNYVLGIQTGTAVPHISGEQIRSFEFSCPPIHQQRAIARILGALDDKIELNRRTNETLEAMARALFHSWFVDFDPVRAKMDGRQPEGMDAETAKLFPSGFDASELGPIPNNWPVGPITALQAPGKYSCVAGPFGSNLTSKDYERAGIPVIRGGNLSTEQFWMRTDEFVFVSPSKAEQLTGSLAYPGDVVLTQRGTLGQVGVIPPDAPYERYVLSQSQMKVAVDRDKGSAAYVAMYFQQPKIVSFILGNGQQAGVPHINLGFLRTFRILLPPAAIARAFELQVQPLLRRVRRLDIQSKGLTQVRDALLPKLLSGELRVPETERAVEAAL